MSKILGEAELITDPRDLLSPVRSNLSEGPMWHARRECLILVLLDRGHVVLLDALGKVQKTIRIGCMVGAAGLCSQENTLVLAVEKGWAFLNIDNGAVQFGSEVEGDLRTRSNDGKVGPDGGFYFGTADREFRENIAGFYRLGCENLKCQKLFGGLKLSNGLDWNTRGDKLYHIDSFCNWLREYEFDPVKGSVGKFRDLIYLCEGKQYPEGLPDGMCVDAAGNLFVAEWGLARISVWKATGELIGYIKTPIDRPTSCAFGGKKLTTLYITSERIAGDPEICGGLMAVELPGFRGKKVIGSGDSCWEHGDLVYLWRVIIHSLGGQDDRAPNSFKKL